MKAMLVLGRSDDLPAEEVEIEVKDAGDDFFGPVYILTAPVSFIARDGSNEMVTWKVGQRVPVSMLHFL